MDGLHAPGRRPPSPQRSYQRSTRATGFLDMMGEGRSPRKVLGIVQISPRGSTALERLSALRQSSPRPVTSQLRSTSPTPWWSTIRLDSRQGVRTYSRQMVQYDSIHSSAPLSSPMSFRTQSNLPLPSMPAIANRPVLAVPRPTRALPALHTARTVCQPTGHPAVLVKVSHTPRGTGKSMLRSPRQIS